MWGSNGIQLSCSKQSRLSCSEFISSFLSTPLPMNSSFMSYARKRPVPLSFTTAFVTMFGLLLPPKTQAVDFDLHQVGLYGGWSALSVGVSSNLVFTTSGDVLRIV